jgi:hypothetical protein
MDWGGLWSLAYSLRLSSSLASKHYESTSGSSNFEIAIEEKTERREDLAS